MPAHGTHEQVRQKSATGILVVLCGILVLLLSGSIIFTFYHANTKYSAGLIDGYSDGYLAGSTDGNIVGYNKGSEDGYNKGYNEAIDIYYDEVRFYRNNACIAVEGNLNYHHYDCAFVEHQSYWIYNVSLAEALGYHPCALCWNKGLID